MGKRKKKTKDIAPTDGEDVRRRLTQGLPLISLDSPRRVKILHLVVRIHGYQNISDVSLQPDKRNERLKDGLVMMMAGASPRNYSRISCP